MCGTCGCSDGSKTTIDGEEHEHVLEDGTVVRHRHAPGEAHGHQAHDDAHHHDHPHDHGHSHSHEEGTLRSEPKVEPIEVQIFAKNDRLAERNRGWFAGREVFAVNLMSSPGAGKTTLLERTLKDLGRPSAVLEGDQETPFDAERIRATGVPVVQINTGKGCHLEADMVWSGLERLKPPVGSVVFIENVGNLVCPALFDLGEGARVVLFSVTEGEDKPLKYPHMFRAADLVVLSKVDLVPHLDFDKDRALAGLREVNPRAEVLELSSKSGEGLGAWFDWIRARSA